MFEESLKSRGVYLEPMQAFTMELFCEYTERLTISAIKSPS